MIACPNCGGNTKFDIASQQVLCEYCDTKYDPYSFDNKASDAVEQNNFEVTIFTCPQCGGEILSTDNAAAGFCSFCGASTILFSRISQEKRPNYIIPFKKTKEDCKKAYGQMMKKAIFAPKELKDPKHIDSFRGIYMPYWAYHLTQQGGYSLKGTKSHRSGDYIITDHFKLNGNIDAYYKGISYDASASFADNISQALAPYDVKGMKAFTPAYLSGFYADASNVNPKIYQPEAEAIAVEESMKEIKKQPEYRGYDMTDNHVTPKQLHTKAKEIDSAMFPVWFMSYRNGDRIAYATVNGQTGKVVSDLPVDVSKYLIGSGVLTIPIFLILNMFLTLVPSKFLIGVIIISILTIILYYRQCSAIKKQENYEDDKGMQSTMIHKPQGATSENEGESTTETTETTVQNESGNSQDSTIRHPMGLSALVIAALISGAVVFFHPVRDYIYYVCGILCLFAETSLLIGTIKSYNVLATRKLPQFDKEGGDDRA